MPGRVTVSPVCYAGRLFIFCFIGIAQTLEGLLADDMLHPAGVLVSSILLAALSSGAETMQVKTGVTSLFLNVLQALIVLFILLGFSFFGTAGKKKHPDKREVKK